MSKVRFEQDGQSGRYIRRREMTQLATTKGESDQLQLKVELEVESDERELEIELKW
jgi:uncharacterized protein (UPF0216 family)